MHPAARAVVERGLLGLTDEPGRHGIRSGAGPWPWPPTRSVTAATSVAATSAAMINLVRVSIVAEQGIGNVGSRLGL